MITIIPGEESRMRFFRAMWEGFAYALGFLLALSVLSASMQALARVLV